MLLDSTTPMAMDTLKAYVESLSDGIISQERKEILYPLVSYIQEKKNASECINLNFICTHNSRRSHLCQVWAQVMAHHFGVQEVSCFSGGTESTRVYPTVIQILENHGMTCSQLSEMDNPIYAIKFSTWRHPVIAFSKEYDHVMNPSQHFAAIMTCSDADDNCPPVYGCERRIPITYEDPKISDGSPEEYQHYSERSHQVAMEMYYVFSSVLV